MKPELNDQLLHLADATYLDLDLPMTLGKPASMYEEGDEEQGEMMAAAAAAAVAPTPEYDFSKGHRNPSQIS